MKLRATIPILLVVAFAFALRVHRLAEAPPSLFIDEAAFGYNAHSILQTGRDEFGSRLPLYTRSFHTGKNPVYLYAVVASVRALGMNDFAVRLPAAALGALEALFLCLLVLEMGGGLPLALLSALFLAVSPWSFHHSRIGTEPITLSCITVAAAACLARSARFPRWALPAAALFGLSLYCYAPGFTFAPLFLAGFAVIFRREVRKNWKIYLAAGAIFAALLIPHLLPGLKGGEQMEYFRQNLITHPANAQFNKNLLRQSPPWRADWIVESDSLRPAAVAARNYFSTFSRDYLFRRGDTSTHRHHLTGYGVLYRGQAALVLLGLIGGFFVLADRRFFALMLWWLAIFPVGSSLTVQWVPMLTRTICGASAFAFLSALGLVFLWKQGSRSLGSPGARMVFRVAIIAALLPLCVNAVQYFEKYFAEYPAESADAFYFGAREAILKAEELSPAYDAVVVDETISFVYMYVLYYTAYPPERLLREARLGWRGPYRVGVIGKYMIGPVRPCPAGVKCLYLTRVPAPGFAKPLEYFGYPGKEKSFALSGD